MFAWSLQQCSRLAGPSLHSLLEPCKVELYTLVYLGYHHIQNYAAFFILHLMQTCLRLVVAGALPVPLPSLPVSQVLSGTLCRSQSFRPSQYLAEQMLLPWAPLGV